MYYIAPGVGIAGRVIWGCSVVCLVGALATRGHALECAWEGDGGHIPQWVSSSLSCSVSDERIGLRTFCGVIHCMDARGFLHRSLVVLMLATKHLESSRIPIKSSNSSDRSTMLAMAAVARAP